jgi:hypothetical protein
MPAIRTVTRTADLDDVVANGGQIPPALLPASLGVTDVSTLATGGTGTLADPYTGWDAAFAALVADGTSFLFNGFFEAAQNIDLSNRTSVTLAGLDGHMGQQPYNDPLVNNWTCGLLFSIEGPNVKAWNTAGITIRGMFIRNDNAATFTTALVDNSGGSGLNVSIGLTIEDCVLSAAGGTGSGIPDSCLKLDNAIECRCTGVCFYGAKYNIRGVKDYPYSTAHSFRHCRFHSWTQAAIFNPHAQWNFRDCIFEPGAGQCRWVRTDNGMSNASGACIQGLYFAGCRQWDSSAIDDVIHSGFLIYNLNIIGCFFSTLGGAIVSTDPAVPIKGLVLVGNYIEDAGGGSVLKPANFGTITNAFIGGNHIDPGVDNLAASVTNGHIASGLVMDAAGDLVLPEVSGSGGSTVEVGEQRTVHTTAVPFNATASKWTYSDGGVSVPSSLTVFNGDGPGPADGDFLEFKVFLTAGTYTLDLSTRLGTDQGKIQFSMGGTDFGALLDLYNGFGVTLNHRITGIAVASSGVKSVRLTVNGKNASSSNYYARISPYWIFTRTA